MIGKCEEMCPEEECEFRIANKLVSIYEKEAKTNLISKKMMIKEFVRSSYQQNDILVNSKEKNIRSLNSLENTIIYLNEIWLKFSTLQETNLKHLYLFINDRIKAIKQDLVRNEKGRKEDKMRVNFLNKLKN